jgi:hypothetical protein
MTTKLSATQLNAVSRLVWIAERCGPQYLDNAERFDEMMGRNCFAELDSEVLNIARSVVKSGLNRGMKPRIDLANSIEDMRQNSLHGISLGG